MSRRAAVAVACLAMRMGLAAFLAGSASPAQEIPAVAERLNVREVELVLEPPPVRKGLADMRLRDFEPADTAVGPGFRVKVPARKGLADLGPGDLLVLEDGKSRPVLRVEPLASGGGNLWTLRIYFDLVLARPDTVFEAALALAGQAARLAQLGTVEVIVADPEPRTILAGSRETLAIEGALADLAGQASRDPQARRGSRAPPPAPASVRRQCDRLVTRLVDAGTAGPHALLLVADSPFLPPAELELLAKVSTAALPPTSTPGISPKAAPATAAAASSAVALGEAARLLAAYGWVTLALPIHRLAGAAERPPQEAFAHAKDLNRDNFQPSTGIPVVSLLVTLVRWLRGKPLEPPPDMRLVASQLDMENAPLVAMVRPTAGTVVTGRELLVPALGALAGRWHIWYQGDASPGGRELPVSVSLLANGQDWRAPRWVHSSTPEDLAAARLRRALDGAGAHGSLSLSATWLRAPLAGNADDGAVRPPATEAEAASASGSVAEKRGGSAAASELLELAVATPVDGHEPPASGPLRLSFAWGDGEGHASVTHQLLEPAAAALWNGHHRLQLAAPPSPPSPHGRMRLAVLIEDLGSELWGAAVVAPPTSSSELKWKAKLR